LTALEIRNSGFERKKSGTQPLERRFLRGMRSAARFTPFEGKRSICRSAQPYY
jgi:hypothetical protein